MRSIFFLYSRTLLKRGSGGSEDGVGDGGSGRGKIILIWFLSLNMYSFNFERSPFRHIHSAKKHLLCFHYRVVV